MTVFTDVKETSLDELIESEEQAKTGFLNMSRKITGLDRWEKTETAGIAHFTTTGTTGPPPWTTVPLSLGGSLCVVGITLLIYY